MSERLAVSASLSVLMMAAYVLFGADTARQPFGSDSLVAPINAAAAAAELVSSPSSLLPIAR